MFSYELCEIFRNTFFMEHLWWLLLYWSRKWKEFQTSCNRFLTLFLLCKSLEWFLYNRDIRCEGEMDSDGELIARMTHSPFYIYLYKNMIFFSTSDACWKQKHLVLDDITLLLFVFNLIPYIWGDHVNRTEQLFSELPVRTKNYNSYSPEEAIKIEFYIDKKR